MGRAIGADWTLLPKAINGRPPYPLETMLRIHLLQNLFALSDPAMKEVLHEITSLRQFAKLSQRQGTIVDATIIQASSPTKNKDGKRDPEMHQTKKGIQCYFGIKVHIGAADSSLVHSVVCTAANGADVMQFDQLLHGEENVVCADAGYTAVEKRPEHVGREVIWQIAAKRSIYKKLSTRSFLYRARRKIEKAKAQMRA